MVREISFLSRRRYRALAVLASAAVVALTLSSSLAFAANSRIYSTLISTPTPVSAGASTTFTVSVSSGDNQTIANMVVTIDLTAGISAWTATYNLSPGATCSPTPTSGTLTCDLGNLAAFQTSSFSVVALTTQTLSPQQITIAASAQTNNENGSNLQIVTGTTTVTPGPYSPNAIQTFDLNGGTASTAPLGNNGSGNLSTTVNLRGFTNNGTGNSIVLQDLTSGTQSVYCTQFKLTCQPDYSSFEVDNSAGISPFLETTLTFVPTILPYNIKKAFVIHVLDSGSIDPGFPLYNSKTTSCIQNPTLIPCADFSQNSSGVVTIVMHTRSNGKGYF